MYNWKASIYGYPKRIRPYGRPYGRMDGRKIKRLLRQPGQHLSDGVMGAGESILITVEKVTAETGVVRVVISWKEQKRFAMEID